ncbi:MAG: hypothetical protein QXD32_07560, partial [Nitrososphaerota archaeon]
KPEKLIPALRSLIARELVKAHGLRKSEAAKVLGITTQAVTQYIGGRRATQVSVLEKSEKTMNLLREYANKVALRRQPIQQAELLDLAFEILTMSQSLAKPHEGALDQQRKERVLRILRGRLQAEQEAAELFMSEAIRSGDDLVRLLFRQVASDSIRHADIMMASIASVERGNVEYSIPDSLRLSQLLLHEERSHAHSLKDVRDSIDNEIIKILIDSIEADEEKHDMILQKLISLGGKR